VFKNQRSAFDISLNIEHRTLNKKGRIQVLMRIPTLYFVLGTSYNNLELHLHPQQEIRSCLWVVEVLRHQLPSKSSRHKVAEGIAVWLVQFVEDVIDQQIHFQSFEEPWGSSIAEPQVIREEGI
jgi:hypothetical protein